MNSKRSKGTGVGTRIVLNLLSDPVVIVDQNGRLIMVNDAFGKTSGLNPEKLRGAHFKDLPIVDSETKALLMEKWKKTMKGTPSAPYEVLFVTPAGEKRIVEMKASRIIYNGEPADLVILRDVTRRKEDAKRLEEYAKRMEALVEEKIKETKESEEKLRRTVDSSPDPIVVSSSDGKVLDCNPAALKTFGYAAKSEVIGRNVIEFFAEKEREKAAENLSREVENARNLEYKFQAKNGREFVGELSFCPVFQPSGEIACFVSTIKDLTERREKEKALRESEERFKQVAENAEEWIWEVDAHGMYTYSSPVVEKILGYKPEEIVGKKHFYDLFHPENQEQLKNTALKGFEQKQPFHGFINKNVHNNGEDVWLSTSGVPMLDQQGKLVGYRGADTDITERRKAEESIRNAEEMYRQLFNTIPSGVAVYKDVDDGEDFVFVDFNKTAEKIEKIPKQKLLGKRVTKVFPGVKDLGLFKVFQRVLRTGQAEYLPTGMYRDGCISGWRENWVYKLPNGAIVAIYNDTTERVKMQKKVEKYSRHLEATVEKRTRELKEANAKLLKAERLATIGELAGMVGHDLRNPLTGIKNAAYYLIRKNQFLDDNSKKMLEIIDSAVSRADKIIGDLQEYSREIQLDLVRYSPKAILQEALAVVQIPTKVKIVDNVLDEPLVMADKTKMVRVFMSIVKNAVDAMPDGGTLQIKSVQKYGNVEVSFSDTGIGIPKEDLNKLFSPLVTTKAQGMGFGLAICKRIIDAHQGSITVKSVEGKGSTFTVTIPIKPKLKEAGELEWVTLSKSYRRRRKHKQQS